MTRPETSYESAVDQTCTWSHLVCELGWFGEVELDGELSLLPALEVWVVPILDDPRVEASRPPLHDLIVTLRTRSREGLTRAHIGLYAMKRGAVS